MALTNDLYLILHKVRGEPTLDVAIPVTIGKDEEAWIIPTSGHRAWPYATWPIHTLQDNNGLHVDIDVAELLPELPDDLRDHYEPSGPKPTIKNKDKTITVPELLAKIGLYRPEPTEPTVKRRV